MKSGFRVCLLTSLLAATASLGACAGAGFVGMGDVFSRDADWFNRPARVFNNSLTLETPPLSEQRPVQPDDLISAEGYCAGMTSPAEANAMTESDQQGTAVPSAPAPSLPAGIALGRTECEVARYAGRPDNVELSNDQQGNRATVLTYLKGPRPGIYHFVAGRLSAVDRAPEPPAPAKPAKPVKPKKKATT